MDESAISLISVAIRIEVALAFPCANTWEGIVIIENA